MKTNSLIIYPVLILLSLGFGITGYRLIIISNDQYLKSIEYTNIVLKDPLLLGKVNFTPNYSVIKDGFSEALLYFTLALGVIILMALLPRLQNINIVSTGISLALNSLPGKLDDIAKQTNAIQANSVGDGGIKTKRFIENPPNQLSNTFPNDPQKGKWGGLSEVNERVLKAQVQHSSLSGLFTVKITVESTNSKNQLRGIVKFHLHNSFINPNPIITVINGTASLNLNKVYGAFTVGAEVDDGNTLLELDLSELKLGDGFKVFLER